MESYFMKWFISLLFIASCLIEQNVKAQAYSPDYNEAINDVLAHEQSGNILEALLISAKTSQQLSDELGVDTAVKEIFSEFTENRKEIVTKKETIGGKFRLLFLNVSGSETINTTKIFTTNPAEVTAFDKRTQDNFIQLQKSLAEYVKVNENAIIYTKAFAAKTLQLATLLDWENFKKVKNLVNTTAQKAMNMSFLGDQDILYCVATKHAKYSDEAHIKFSSLLLSFNLSVEEEHMKYEETSCEMEKQQTYATDALLISERIHHYDSLIAQYMKQAGLMELQNSQAPNYPTWGSPYYK